MKRKYKSKLPKHNHDKVLVCFWTMIGIVFIGTIMMYLSILGVI